MHTRYNLFEQNTLQYDYLHRLTLPTSVDRTNSSNIVSLLNKAYTDAEILYSQAKNLFETVSHNYNGAEYDYLPYLYSIQYIPRTQSVSPTPTFSYINTPVDEIYQSRFSTVFIDMYSQSHIFTREISTRMSNEPFRRMIIPVVDIEDIPSFSALYNVIPSDASYIVSRSTANVVVDTTSADYQYVLRQFLINTFTTYDCYGVCLIGGSSACVEQAYSALNNIGKKCFIKTATPQAAENIPCDGVLTKQVVYTYQPGLADIANSDDVYEANIASVSTLQSQGKQVYSVEFAMKPISIQRLASISSFYEFSVYAVPYPEYNIVYHESRNASGEYIAVSADGSWLHRANRHQFYYGESVRRNAVFSNGRWDSGDEIESIEQINVPTAAAVDGSVVTVSGLSGVYPINYVRVNTYYHEDDTLYLRRKYNTVAANSQLPGTASTYHRIYTPLDHLCFSLDIDRREGETNPIILDKIINTQYYRRDDSELGIRNSIAIDNNMVQKATYSGSHLELAGASPESIRINGLRPEYFFIFPHSDSGMGTPSINETITIPAGRTATIYMRSLVDRRVTSIETDVNMPILYISGIAQAEPFFSPARVHNRHSYTYATDDVFVPGTLQVYYHGNNVTQYVTEVGRSGFTFSPYDHPSISGVSISGISSVPFTYGYGDVVYTCVTTGDSRRPYSEHRGAQYNMKAVIRQSIEIDKEIAYGGDVITYAFNLENITNTNATINIIGIYPLHFNNPIFSPYSRTATDCGIDIVGYDQLVAIGKQMNFDVRYIRTNDIEVNTMSDQYVKSSLMNSDGTLSPTMRNIIEQIDKHFNIVYGKAVWDLSMWLPQSLLNGYLSYSPNVTDPDTSLAQPLREFYIRNIPTIFGESCIFGQAIFGGSTAITEIINEAPQRDGYDSGIGDNDDLKPSVDEVFTDDNIDDNISARHLRVNKGFYSIANNRKYMMGRRAMTVADNNVLRIPLYNSDSVIYDYDQMVISPGAEVFVYALDEANGATSKYMYTINGVDHLVGNQFRRVHFTDMNGDPTLTFTERIYGNGYNNILYTSFNNIRDLYITDRYGRHITNFQSYDNRVHIRDVVGISPMVYSDGTYHNYNMYYKDDIDKVYAPVGNWTPEQVAQYDYKYYSASESFSESPAISSDVYFNVSYTLNESYYVHFDSASGYATIVMSDNTYSNLVVYDSINIHKDDDSSTDTSTVNYTAKQAVDESAFLSSIKFHPSVLNYREGFVYISDKPEVPSTLKLRTPMPSVSRSYTGKVPVYITVSSINGSPCPGTVVEYTISWDGNTSYNSMITGQTGLDTIFVDVPANIIDSTITIYAEVSVSNQSGKQTFATDSVRITVIGE